MEPIAAVAAALVKRRAHPLDSSALSGVEHVQTHISHLFLTRDRVYKLRKSVTLSFLDFSTASARNADCLREVALNRRLAPNVYLGVAPVLAVGTDYVLGPVRENLLEAYAGAQLPEHCVVMRRLPERRDALSLLRSTRLRPEQLDAAARRLATFHREGCLGVPAPFEPGEWIERVERPVQENFRIIRELDVPGLDRVAIDRLEHRARDRFAVSACDFEARRRAGRAVDGHGDVHLQHLWFEAEQAEPLFIDCIEFSRDLRCLDVASEVAFLAMDLVYRGERGLAERFLRSYARETDDFHLYAVVDYYASYRAVVRGKVAALSACDPGLEPDQRSAAAASAIRHLAVAETFLEPRSPGALVLLCGTVGSGKSTVAEALAEEVDGVVVSSDRTRKRQAGLEVTVRSPSPPGAGLYSETRNEAVYRGLLERAAAIVESGRHAILDATFSRRAHRRAARAWAAQRGISCLLVEVRCRADVALERLAMRATTGGDPSDAGPSLYRHSLATFEAPEEWPAPDRVVVVSDSAAWGEEIATLAERIRSG